MDLLQEPLFLSFQRLFLKRRYGPSLEGSARIRKNQVFGKIVDDSQPLAARAGAVTAVKREEPRIELLKSDAAPRTIETLTEDPFPAFRVQDIDGPAP
jgi:hypothetical protein